MKDYLQRTSVGVKVGIHRILRGSRFCRQHKLAILSQRHQDIKAKTDIMDSLGKQTGLNIYTTETKLIKINARNEEPVTIDDTAKKWTNLCTWEVLKINSDGNSEKDADTRISKARGAFTVPHSIWRSTHIKRPTKLRIFKNKTDIEH